MASTGTQYRQGDVLPVAAPQLPAGLLPTGLLADRAHALQPPAAASGVGNHQVPPSPGLRAFRSEGSDGPTERMEGSGGSITLTQPEHAPLTLEPGIWRIVRQREYDPATADASYRVMAD